MVAIIKTGHSIKRILNYNENKVKDGVAKCISLSNYPIDIDAITFKQKLNRLLKQVSLNENVSRNSVHISLNFHPSEKLSNDQLVEISDAYMQKIGFGDQPYLVYQHFDSGHPHIHIVSIKVSADGTRVNTHNIGRNQSERARKEIERDYRLVEAENMKNNLYEPKPISSHKVQYGKSESRRAIAIVLNNVVNTYKYTSIAELNAVLQQYNVFADRGMEESRVNQNRGLVYRVLDENGNPTGVPIKASLFYNKPTLKNIEAKFTSNERDRQTHKARVRNSIDFELLAKSSSSLEALILALEKEGIKTVVRRNKEGVIYGLTYVDYKTKCVFNGSDLGKPYSAKGILERCSQGESFQQKDVLQKAYTRQIDVDQNGVKKSRQEPPTHTSNSVDLNKAVDDLLQPIESSSYVPHQFKKRKKKKQKNNSTKM